MKKIVKQIIQEPLEILKEAKGQIAPTVEIKPQIHNEEQQKIANNQSELQDKMKASRRMEAYKRELEDIRKQDLFSSLQEKIANGEDVPLKDYPGLSMEQKQVLNAQKEAVAYQKEQAEYLESQKGGSLFGSAKRGRKMGTSQKQEAEKQQTRVEKPVPPSG